MFDLNNGNVTKETAGSRGVTPLGLPSGMLTYDNTQGEGMAGVGGVAMAGTIPPAAAGEPPTTVSNWKESGLVAAFSSHWIRQ